MAVGRELMAVVLMVLAVVGFSWAFVELVGLVVAMHRLSPRERRRRAGFVHNVVAHPLLVLCPPVGVWLHDRTDPGEMPR